MRRFTEEDEIYIKRLIEWITEHADYGDIDELCKELHVPEYWFEHFYEFEM